MERQSAHSRQSQDRADARDAGFTRAASAQDGFSPDAQLTVDIRNFEVALDPTALAHVKIADRLLGADGKIIGDREFEATSPAVNADADGVFAALNEAFGKAAHELGLWMEKTPKDPPTTLTFSWPRPGRLSTKFIERG